MNKKVQPTALRCVLIGAGDIARRLVPLLQGHYRVIVASRFGADNPRAAWQALKIQTLILDLDQPQHFARVGAFAQRFVVLAPPGPVINRNCSPTQPHNIDAIQETGAQSNQLSHMIDPRMNRLLAHLPPTARGVYVSTSGVYGDRAGAWLSEVTRPRPQTLRGQKRLVAEHTVRSWGKKKKQHTSLLRVPGIYARNRSKTATKYVLPASEDVYTNHIHADDLAHIIYQALRFGRTQRVYHASDDSQIMHADYSRLVAKAQGLPLPCELPRQQLQAAVSPMYYSFLTESRRLNNQRMKTELAVHLRWPTVEDHWQETTGAQL